MVSSYANHCLCLQDAYMMTFVPQLRKMPSGLSSVRYTFAQHKYLMLLVTFLRMVAGSRNRKTDGRRYLKLSICSAAISRSFH